MPTVQEILGQKPITVESILGEKPLTEEISTKISESENDREKFIKDQYFEVTGEQFPTGEEVKINIPPEIQAIPPTLWELVKSQIPGVKLLGEEFRQAPWWLVKKELPPEFDTENFTIADIQKLNEEAQKIMPDKAQMIAKEATDLTSFFLFPTQMKMLGELVGPVVEKFAPTLYKILTKEIRFGRRPIKIPEKEVKPEIKPEVKAEIVPEEKPLTFEEALAESEAKTTRLREIQQKWADPENAFESTVKYDPHQAMAEAGTESMLEKGIKRDPDKLMTEQLIDEWLSDPSKYENIMARYGMTPQEWAKVMREQASSWGKKLGELGIEARRLGKEIPEIGEALAELEQIAKTPSAWDKIQNGWKNLDRVRRGLLVTQLSTAVRNGFSQAARVGMDIPEKAMNYYLGKLFRLEPKGSPLDGVEQLVKVLQRGESKRIAESVLEAFPKQYSRMYSTYMSDIEVGKLGQTISRGVDILNTANRFQEFLYRNGVFTASLEQGLRKEGVDLAEIIEKRAFKDIPQEVVEKAVSKALEMTFAETPKWGTIGQKFVSFVTSMPGATFILPFPRFLVNSLKFNFEYSPMGLLKLLSAKERAAFAAGDVHVLSRAIIGSAMLGTAWQIRNSDLAGEKWNEVKVGNKTINMMAYNPFAVYLFMADILKKAKDGTLYKLTGKDVSLGILSSNIRAGTGLYTVDQIINAVSRTGDPEKASDLLKTFAGEVAGGLLTPVNQIKEFAAGFDDYIVKEKRIEPFWGPIKEKIPIIEKTLPIAYSPTREGPITRELPATRQLTGLMMKTKNTFEKEIDRLGFSYQEIFHSIGDVEADNLIKKYMGIMATRMAIPLIESKDYESLTEGQKGLVLANLLNEMRNTAKSAAEEENPTLFAKIKLERIPKRELMVLQEQGLDIKELEKQLTP